MRRVYLIRHGKPEFPGGQRMCLGTTDIPMGPEGLAQARKMAARLPPVTAVFSSSLIRSVQTAQSIGLPVRILPGLQELDAGQWDGLTFQEIRQRYPELYAARGADLSLPMPGAEDRQQGLARFRKALETAADSCQGDFAVISHGGIMEVFLNALGSSRGKPDYVQIIPLRLEAGEFGIEEEIIHA